MTAEDFNPYAAPQADFVAEPVAEGDVWCDGRLLVLRKESLLPDRCVQCNEPVEGRRLKRRLYWHPWPIYLLLLAAPIWCLGLLLYLIIALIVRHSAIVQIGICRRHRNQRWLAIAVGWLVVVAGVGLMFLSPGAGNDMEPFIALGGFATLLVGAFYGAIRSRIVVPKRIDRNFVWLKGVCPAYLAELPPSPIRL